MNQKTAVGTTDFADNTDKEKVTVQVWGRPPVCQLAGPLARRFDANRNTESETP